VTREKCDFAPFQRAEDVGVRRRAERRLHAHFFNFGESGHGIQSATPDDADFRLCHSSSEQFVECKLVIIQDEFCDLTTKVLVHFGLRAAPVEQEILHFA
jgi:hypothetical protein